MNTAQWHPFEYALKYRLGEITLGQTRFSVLRKVFSLDQIRNCNAPHELPPLPAELDGYLLANAPNEGALSAVEREDGYISYSLKSYTRSYIDMTGDFSAYQAKFSGKTRSGINRKVRKFADHAGGLDFRCYKGPAELAEFFNLARPVSANSYQERLLDCGLPDNQDFVDDAIQAAAHDEVRAFLLFAQGEPVSYLYCPVDRGILQYAYLGYRPEHSKLSPGTVLQWLAMESLFAEQRFTAFDFTEGDSEHKRFFSTHQIPCTIELLLRATLANRIKLGLHQGISAASDAAVQALDRMGLKQRIKRWIRRAA